MRLLHVFPSFEIGGAQARFAQIANRFAGRLDHALIALDGNDGARCLLNPAVRLDVVKIDYKKTDQLRSLLRFRRALDAVPHDVLLTYNWGAVEWAFANLLRRPSRHVHLEDGFGPEEADRQLRRRVLFRRVALAGRHTTVVVPSRTLLAIAGRIWKLPPGRVVHVPNGVDCARFRHQPRRRDPGTPTVIGTVATLRPEKNIGRLIQAFAMVAASADVRLVIVGDGPDRSLLERQCAALGQAGRVQFVGATAAPERHYRDMDIFALSSDTEQMPYSILEAMACGLPVVSTDVGDVADMLAPGNRPLVVDQPTPEALARALSALVENPARRHELGEQNREAAAARFDLELMLARYRSLFEGGPPP